MKLREEKGFTLIEIMVVVIIIGLLATIVSINVMRYLSRSKVETCKAQLKALSQALELYKLDNGFYPTTEQGLQALVEKPASGPEPKNWKPYLTSRKVPKDPWGNDYYYISDGQTYTLKCLGADGEPGGEGENADIDAHSITAE